MLRAGMRLHVACCRVMVHVSCCCASVIVHAACPGVHKPFPASMNFKLGRRRGFSNIDHDCRERLNQSWGETAPNLRDKNITFETSWEHCLGGRGERGPGLLKIV